MSAVRRTCPPIVRTTQAERGLGREGSWLAGSRQGGTVLSGRSDEAPIIHVRGTPMLYVLNLIAAMHARIQRDDENDRGATATEYAMLVAFIAIAITVGVGLFGTELSNWFTNLGNKIGL